MASSDDILNYLYEQRETSLDYLKAIDEGVLSLRENRGTYWVNVTDDWSDRLKRDVQKLDRLIATHERRGARQPQMMN